MRSIVNTIRITRQVLLLGQAADIGQGTKLPSWQLPQKKRFPFLTK
jgi:hypothetical protein